MSHRPAAATLTYSRVRQALLALLAAVVVVFAPTAAAMAHSGPWQLVVAPDGAGGLSVFGTYVEDGHTVTEIMDPVATAVSADGRSAGPVSLVSSAEGEGVWVTTAPFLDEGEWTVTVATTTPAVVTSSTAVSVQAPEPPAQEAANTASEGSEQSATAENTAAPDRADDSLLPLVLWIIAGALAVAVIVTLVVLRRRRPAA